MASNNNAQARVRNAVHEDAIWRQMIHYELNTAGMWEKNWGFMKDLDKQDETEEKKPSQARAASKDKLSEANSSQYPVKHNYLRDEVAENYLLTYNVNALKAKIPIEDKYVHPVTAANEIGWKWHDMKLEKYGQAKGKQNPSWAGSIEAMP